MPYVTKLRVESPENDFRHEREVETVEQGLKDIAAEAKRGEIPLPYTVTFEGDGMTFTVTVATTEASDELARKGFMY